MALNQTFGENPLFCFKVNAKKKKKKRSFCSGFTSCQINLVTPLIRG